MARLFVAIGGLIVLALTAALVAPFFVDWTSYRADFEREAGRILGRDVTVRGAVTARLLPFPSVNFTDVAVAGVNPGETAMTVETFSMDAELAPFIRGDIHIFDMRLVRPVVLVDLAADGALDWAIRPSVPVGASHISLESLTVTEGRVELRHAASGRTHRLTEINAAISARALTGPWRVDGSLRLDGMRMALQASTGQADGAGGMRLRVQARPERYALALETDGNARIEDGRALYSGGFRLNAPVGAEPARTEPPAYRLSGTFALDHAALAVEAFRFETGPVQDPYVAEGSASFDLGASPRFLIRADGAQIRFEDSEEGDGSGGRFDLRQRLEALHEFLLDAPRPTIPGRIEMMLPAVVAGDTTARDVHLFAEPSEKGWSVASLGATLPGRATLEAKGELAIGEEALGFDGSLLVAVAQPSGFAAWLARDVDDAIRRLPAAGFSAEVALSPERQTFRDLELVLGGATFRGEAESRTPAGLRPSLALKLDGDRLDVEGMAVFASLFVSDDGKSRLTDRDLEFEIAAGPVSAAGLTADTLDTALRLKGGRLEIDRLAIGGLEGANVSATGTLDGIGDSGSVPSGSVDASIIAVDLASLISALARRFPDSRLAAQASGRAQAYPGLYGDASLRLEARLAESGAVVADVSGEAGGTALKLDARMGNLARDLARDLSGVPLAAELTAQNDEAAALYALFGLPALPLGLAGPAEAKLTFDGTIDGGGEAGFTFSGDDVNLVFKGEAGLAQAGLSASGEASLASDDLEPWLAAAGVALPGFGLGLPAALETRLDIDGGLLVLSGLRGEIVGAAVSGDVNASLRDGRPHLTGALALGGLDLAPLAELVVGAAALTPGGEGGWPDAPFAAAASSPLTAELDLAAGRLWAGDFAEAQDARMRLKLERDGFSLADLAASMLGGSVSGIVDFRNDGGTGLLSAQLRLDNAAIAALIGAEAGLSGTAGLTASVTASGKSVDGLVAALAGSGTAAARDIVISGVAPDVFPDLIARADDAGADIDAAAVAAFAPPLVRAGSFGAAGVDIAFTLANGSLRAPPFRLETEGAALAGQVGADLAARSVEAEATLIFDPGPEALAGAEPAVRFIASGPPDSIRVEVDTAPLAQFLTQRALELEQQRVEAMQAALTEKQRLRREVRYYAALDAERAAAAEAARRAAEEAARLERERIERDRQEQLRREEETERRRLEDEARRAGEEARRQAEEQAAREREADEDARLRAEVEALLRARAPETPAPTPQSPDVTPMPAPRDMQAEDAPPVLDGASVSDFLKAIGADR